MSDPNTEDNEGRVWIIETESGATYQLNPWTGTAYRVPGERAGQLRRDSDPIPLLQFTTPVVGRPMILLLRVREDGVTVRTTTPVVRIDRGRPPVSGTGTSTP